MVAGAKRLCALEGLVLLACESNFQVSTCLSCMDKSLTYLVDMPWHVCRRPQLDSRNTPFLLATQAKWV